MVNIISSLAIFAAVVYCRSDRGRRNLNEHRSEYDWEHSLEPPYVDSEFGNKRWNFGGHTIIKVSDYVRLTSDDKSQKGWVSSETPLKAESWAIEVHFKVHGANPVIHGDGFAIWFTEEKITEGDVFGAKDKFKGLGIFLDTYANSYHPHGFPYVSAMLGDGKTSYDHDHDNQATVAGTGCQLYFRTEEFFKIKITYTKSKILKVDTTSKSGSTWDNCFTLSNVEGLNSGYIGLSAATGDVHDNHDILRLMAFTKIDENDATNAKNIVDSKQHIDLNNGESSEVHSGTWTFFSYLFRVVGVGVIVGVAFIAYRTYAGKSSNSKKF